MEWGVVESDSDGGVMLLEHSASLVHWYIGTFVLRASSIVTDSVRLARSGLNQVGLQHFF